MTGPGIGRLNTSIRSPVACYNLNLMPWHKEIDSRASRARRAGVLSQNVSTSTHYFVYIRMKTGVYSLQIERGLKPLK